MRISISSVITAGLIIVTAPASAQIIKPQPFGRSVSAVLTPELVSTYHRRRHHCNGMNNGNCRLFRHNF